MARPAVSDRLVEADPPARLRSHLRGARGAGVTPLIFRFHSRRHEYVELATGEVRPHITGLLEASGWIDDRWYTEEASERGTHVHQLTAEYDLGALDPARCESGYRGYLLGHVAAMMVLRPEILAVEVPRYHPTLRFGGRPDRVVRTFGAVGPLEGKSGQPARSHEIQTALQAILLEPWVDLPAEMQQRLCLYWRPNGRFRLREHKERRDFQEARRILREYGR